MRTLSQRIAIFFQEDVAQGLVEYTLLLAFLAMAAAGILTQVGLTVQGPWNRAGTTLEQAGATNPSTASDPSGGGDGGDGGHGDHHGH